MSNMSKKVIHLVAAARPNFMKVAPLYHALKSSPWADPQIVHTGQHYDFNMSDAFFRDLGLPEPTYHLGVGSGSHAEQTGGVMIAYERICVENRPDWIIVPGDVNSTAACAMVGAKLWIPVAHLEAGLRSGDRRMPEEINRLVTDSISDLLWTPSEDADENLLREGVPASKIDRIGNIMIDSYEMLREKIEDSDAVKNLGLEKGSFAVLTMHRPSNVDDKETLTKIVSSLEEIAVDVPLVYSSHPRTLKNLREFDLLNRIEECSGITLLEPVPYIDFMNIVTSAKFVITDSGGLQEETTYLGIPCITLRENTERPITETLGTNRLVGPDDLLSSAQSILAGEWPPGTCPPLWDGQTAKRAVASLEARLSN